MNRTALTHCAAMAGAIVGAVGLATYCWMRTERRVVV